MLKCKIICQNVNKVVFWLPNKIPKHYTLVNCTKYQKATEEKDGSENWPMRNILENYNISKSRTKWNNISNNESFYT
jgi:hypothetical protein